MAIAEVVDKTLRQRAVLPYNQSSDVTVQQVEDDARHFLNRYVHENLRANGADADVLGQLDHTARRSDNTRLARTLCGMADELNANPSFQQWISNHSTIEGTVEMFVNVVEELFADGVFNYGRVAALFCFTMAVCLKVLQKRLGVNRILDLISWTMRFFRDRVAPWIVGRGGWDTVDGTVTATSPSAAEAAVKIVTKTASVVVIVGIVSYFALKLFGRRI